MPDKCIPQILSSLLLILVSTMLPAMEPTGIFACFAHAAPPPHCQPAYNPAAYCRCGTDELQQNGNIAFRFDFLWWRATESGTTLGSEEVVSTMTTRNITGAPIRSSLVNRSYLKNLHSHFKPGFRIGMDYICLCEEWDAAVNWTHFHTNASATGKSRFSERETRVFISDWERVFCLEPNRVKGKWKLELDLLDFELGRKFYVSSGLVLRPQFGLRGARISQSYRVGSWANSPGRLIGLTDIFFSNARSTALFMALGPRVGCSVEYRFGCGLSLFGEAATAILFGRFDRHAREHSDLLPDGGGVQANFDYQTSTGFDHSSRTITDLSVGINFCRCFDWCGRSRQITLSMAWEHHAFNQLNAFNFASDGFSLPDLKAHTALGKSGNLYTQGLTFSASIGF